MSIEFYNTANDFVVKSHAFWAEKEFQKAFHCMISARLHYICEMIACVVKLPFASLFVFFGLLHGLWTCNRKAPFTRYTYQIFSDTINHLILSSFGGFISPTLAHKYKDVNLTPAILIVRVTAMVGFVIYAALKSH